MRQAREKRRMARSNIFDKKSEKIETTGHCEVGQVSGRMLIMGWEVGSERGVNSGKWEDRG